MKLLKKATISHIVGAAAIKQFKEYAEETPICRIIGSVRSATMKPTPHGHAPCFVGNIATINLLTGEQGRATTLYLPEPVATMLYETVEMADDEAKRQGIEFGFDVTVEPASKSATGYVYNVKTLMQSKAADPLAHLLEAHGSVQASAPKLAAPTEEPAPAESAVVSEAETSKASKSKADK